MDQFEWKPEYLKKFEKFKPARERAVREIVGKLETKYCEKCPGRHMVQIFRDMVDDDTKMKFQSLFTEVYYNLFKKKRKMVMDVCGNSLINPLCVQCPLCCNIVSLGHINEIFIKGDKLVNHLTTIHCRECIIVSTNCDSLQLNMYLYDNKKVLTICKLNKTYILYVRCHFAKFFSLLIH